MKLKLGLLLATAVALFTSLAAQAGIFIEVGDRPYYNRGPGYYVGRSYYVWVPGHWNRHHRWIHGHYAIR